MSIKGRNVIEILKDISVKMDENKAYLSELDATIGDGDHGLNMSKGFKAVLEKLKDDDGSDIAGILKKTGMALVSNVGGASGPLYGTAFMKAALSINGKSEIDINDFEKMLIDALEGIKMRGKGQAGDKTMIDAIEPALEAIKDGIAKGFESKEILRLTKEAAYRGVEHTKDIIAKKGRASYLGERSIGHQDAGATSAAIILETIYEAFK
ncbi:dihydroxyacetone kinase subunit DhaL [Clostridium sp. YIM B02551]|uniref:dihydroxyacetone kinase subunit DhaL n=1 Tax=Clostridium sp. YIM B02551 TaxID=2910679 RepID=UPI001EEB41BA|nr:dihydroxyacetone kinase subunit DhaL [Clostridium sp. YIM B02551]